MSGYSLINCTPHALRIAADLIPGQRLVRTSHWHTPPVGWAADKTTSVVVIRPSGMRFSCDSVTYGPDLGCGVRYELSAEAEAEREQLWLACESAQGSDIIAIASEISVRCLADSLDQGDAGIHVRAMWPVLATESLRLPMSQRWADKLATLPQ